MTGPLDLFEVETSAMAPNRRGLKRAAAASSGYVAMVLCATGTMNRRGQLAGTRLTSASPRSNAVMLWIVVCMICPMASWVKKA